MKYTVTINNHKYEVEVEASEKTAEFGDSPMPNPSAANTPLTSATASNFSEIIKAPMPGTILDIKVSLGQNVKNGEVLLILEAMKMENEIVSPRDGSIAQIHVSKGASVNTGDALITLN